jgi:hypothetical protein
MLPNLQINKNLENINLKQERLKIGFMTKEKKQKPKKFSWKEHNKWLDEFRSPPVLPENKPTKRKRGKK